jgi:hypothetical protein
VICEACGEPLQAGHTTALTAVPDGQVAAT